jgi:hypothetical protein
MKFKKYTPEDLMQDDYNYNALCKTTKDYIEGELKDYKFRLLEGMVGCASPIEQIMSAALGEVSYHWKLVKMGIEFEEMDTQYEIVHDKKLYYGDLHILALSPSSGKGVRVIVECDGHAFHEKTKEQAKNDKQRERAFMLEGYHIIRFTGSEIYNNPRKCAYEVVKIICKLFIDMKG